MFRWFLRKSCEAYLGEVIPLAEYQRRRKDLEQRDEALAAQESQLQAKTLSGNQYLGEDELCASEMNEPQVILGLLFPTHQEPPRAV